VLALYPVQLSRADLPISTNPLCWLSPALFLVIYKENITMSALIKSNQMEFEIEIDGLDFIQYRKQFIKELRKSHIDNVKKQAALNIVSKGILITKIDYKLCFDPALDEKLTRIYERAFEEPEVAYYVNNRLYYNDEDNIPKPAILKSIARKFYKKKKAKIAAFENHLFSQRIDCRITYEKSVVETYDFVSSASQTRAIVSTATKHKIPYHAKTIILSDWAIWGNKAVSFKEIINVVKVINDNIEKKSSIEITTKVRKGTRKSTQKYLCELS
jgi:hypothetical protein